MKITSVKIRIVKEKLRRGKAKLRRLRETVQDLEDVLRIEEAVLRNAGKPLIPWEVVAKELGICPPPKKRARKS